MLIGRYPSFSSGVQVRSFGWNGGPVFPVGLLVVAGVRGTWFQCVWIHDARIVGKRDLLDALSWGDGAFGDTGGVYPLGPRTAATMA